jgi:hypothetical protein
MGFREDQIRRRISEIPVKRDEDRSILKPKGPMEQMKFGGTNCLR